MVAAPKSSLEATEPYVNGVEKILGYSGLLEYIAHEDKQRYGNHAKTAHHVVYAQYDNVKVPRSPEKIGESQPQSSRGPRQRHSHHE